MVKNKIKELIIEANNQLEAHNFEEADRICKKAIKLDYNNPNIYLIQLLAEYRVTEIEDLENCDIDFNSDNYRDFAGLVSDVSLLYAHNPYLRLYPHHIDQASVKDESNHEVENWYREKIF